MITKDELQDEDKKFRKIIKTDFLENIENQISLKYDKRWMDVLKDMNVYWDDWDCFKCAQ